MKRYYSKFRIMLMTFALGLASVFMVNGSLQSSDEVPVNLPKTESGKVQVVFPRYIPRYIKEMPNGGGSAVVGIIACRKFMLLNQNLTEIVIKENT